MVFGLFNNKSDKNLQDVFLGNGSYSLKISKQYLINTYDQEGTVMINPKGIECITLRIDVLSFNPKDDSVEPTTGYDYLLSDVDNRNKELYLENGRAIACSEKKTVEDGINLIMKFWEIGCNDNKLIIISGTILEDMQNDKRVKKLLASIPEIIKSIEPTKKQISIETSSGIVNYTTTKQEPINQKITQLNEDEREFINSWIENGKNIILYYAPDLQQSDLNFKLLDSVFDSWMNDKNNERFSSDSIANGLGVTFGELLSKELTMEWVKVNDEYGEEYGVRSQNNFTSFPISSVSKRIEIRESGFFNDIFEMLKHAIED